ncbi:MAG: ROK family protein [Helicobacteraceae bacterium]|jgi:glucokinase|nr:ROK family protein [Helicobacteraceae bacterium]
MKLVFDIGATRLKRGVLDDRGGFVSIDDRLIQGDLQTELKSLIAETIAKYPIGFIGVSFAGQTTDNKISSAPNIDLGELKGADFTEWTRRRFSINGAIDNDLKCAALAEAADRSQVSALFTLYIGTGIGGAYIENGVLIRGANNNAGEIGHIPFEKTPFLCGCGGEDCLESSASGTALRKWRDYYGLQERTLSELNASNEPKAKEVASRFYRGVDRAVRTSAALFNPQAIVLGGGVAVSEKSVLARARAAANNAFRSAVTVELTRLGDKANLLGASMLQG